MDPNELRDTLLNYPAVTEEEPFGPDVIVYKVLSKMYALSTYETPLTVNLKCDPDRAVTLRNQFDAVKPGYHMNKKHWNTVTLDGSVPREEILAMIQHSYDLVVQGMSKKDQAKVKEESTHTGNKDNDWRDEFLRDISR
jgi:predicted DNA-binding protein (MmcQ/YjbR family)